MPKVWIKLGDPRSTFEDGKTKLSGTDEIHVETTDKIDRAIRAGILVKIADEDRIIVHQKRGTNAADEKEKPKS